MPKYLPICLNLEGRRVLVIGGGGVGTQKVEDFTGHGAEVTVISPEISPSIRSRVDAGEVRWLERRYQPGDTAGYFLIAVATDDPEANHSAFLEADAAGQLVNVCDDPPNCNYIFASRIERGPLTVSIFTHGTSPALSRRVRRELQAWLGPEYEALANLLAELRPRIRALDGLRQPERQRIFERIVYSEALLLFREGRSSEARAMAEKILMDELRLLEHPLPAET